MSWNLLMILMYRAAPIGALLYCVGYLGFSGWWLLLLVTLVTFDGEVK